MSCCGGKRTALRNSFQTSSNVKPAPVTQAAPPPVPARTSSTGSSAAPAGGAASAGAVTLRYLAGAPIQVIGPATRATYRFSVEAPLQRIARADVEALLASGYFRLEF